MAKEFGAFNIKTNQYLGNDDKAWLVRDDLRSVVLWGEMDTDTGRFVATRNPVKFLPELETKASPEGEIKVQKMTMDNSTDYRGSTFFDEAFMQRGTEGHIEVKDVAAYAAHLSQQAKDAMIGRGELVESAHTAFFKMPE